MSFAYPIDCICPACGHKNRVTLWQSVNATVDPALAEKVVDGSIFEYTCARCDQIIPVQYPTVLHDMDRGVWYQFRPAGLSWSPEDEAEARRYLAQFNQPGRPYTFRVVRDLNAFIELAHIWRDGLDDGVMLMIKHLLASQVQEETGRPPVICNFDRLDESADSHWLAYVVCRSTEEEPELYMLPLEQYNALQAQFAPCHDRVFPPGEMVRWDAQTARLAWELMRKG